MRLGLCFLSLFYLHTALAQSMESQPATQTAASQSQTAPPSQDEMERAAVLFQKAQASYNVQDFEAALRDFKEAYLLSREPALILNVGQCYRFLGRTEEALNAFRTFLFEDPETPYRADVEQLIAQLQEAQRSGKEARSAPTGDSIAQGGLAEVKTLVVEEPAAIRALYGTALASGVLGVVSGSVSLFESFQAKKAADLSAGRAPDPALVLSLSSRAKTFALASDLLLVASVATGVGGFLVARKHHAEISLAPSPSSLSLSIRF